MWGEVNNPLVNDQWPHNPHFVENSHERPFSIIPKANTYGFLTKKWSPPEIQECDCWGLVLKCYELRTRQHRILNVKALRPLKHYFPEDLMSFGRRL
jgi:hypothetical protein